MNDTLKIFNAFGFKPRNTYISAGSDYFFPIIDGDNEYQKAIAWEAFKKSYKVSDDVIQEILVMFKEYLTDEQYEKHFMNVLHLYLALGSRKLEDIRLSNGNVNGYFIEDICYFCDNYLVWDSKGNPGVCVNLNDTLFVNSGIKVALHKDDAGLYVNKSGMGNRGWDVRACLVDEDYAGYVHLSMAYTKDTLKKDLRTVYCGDKLTQMMIVTVKHYNIEEVNELEYNEIMKNSERGSNAIGSSDVKH